jgi:hypothetical protein
VHLLYFDFSLSDSGNYLPEEYLPIPFHYFQVLALRFASCHARGVPPLALFPGYLSKEISQMKIRKGAEHSAWQGRLNALRPFQPAAVRSGYPAQKRRSLSVASVDFEWRLSDIDGGVTGCVSDLPPLTRSRLFPAHLHQKSAFGISHSSGADRSVRVEQ